MKPEHHRFIEARERMDGVCGVFLVFFFVGSGELASCGEGWDDKRDRVRSRKVGDSRRRPDQASKFFYQLLLFGVTVPV
jgi:hypothetical protein